ncbi:MAG: hypothetical protein M3N43_06625 [Actinomycetota bacterium]|nr:hypothetical protein [Actinomycetota bacterium]
MAGTKTLSAPDFNGLKGTNAADGTAADDLATKGQVDTAETNAKSRANHTGSQTASTVSDFDTQVRTSRLDQMAAPTGALSVNSQRVTNVSSATTDTDVAQWGQVKDLLSGQRKTDVRAAATGNINIASAPSAIDGITLAASDRVLLPAQSTGHESGIYVFASAGAALTRATDADNASEFATAWLVTVREGTANGDTLWKHSTDGTVTLGTTTIEFDKIGPIGAGPSTGYTTTCPSVSAGGTWVVTHNLGSRYVLASVARVASPYDIVDVRIERTTTNTISVLPDVALSSGEFEIMVHRVA